MSDKERSDLTPSPNEPTEKPAREFWIVPEDRCDIGQCYNDERKGLIHVIEYSAYVQEKMRADNLEKKYLELQAEIGRMP